MDPRFRSQKMGTGGNDIRKICKMKIAGMPGGATVFRAGFVV